MQPISNSFKRLYLAALVLCIAAPGFNALASDEASYPPNVILIIGDGMDDVQISIARNYLVGANGRLILDSLPVRSTAQVLTVDEENPDLPVYVADSANSATSISTGIVTSRGRIGTRAGSDEDVVTILEQAQQKGLKTGLVATSSVTDATPASFAAHVKLRMCADPANMIDITYMGVALGSCPDDLIANGGPGSISEQLANSGVDVILGGGSKHFETPTEAGGESVSDLARRNGFEVVTTGDELASLPAGKRVLGLFGESTLPVRTRGEDGRGAEKADPSLLNSVHWYLGSVELPEPMKCEANPDYGNTPSLKAMTDAALLQLGHENKNGFFLMIESASIDKQAHARNACGSIGELEQLNEALESALAFAEKNPNTLILVTADHGHAAQIIPYESLFGQFGAPVYSLGQIVRLMTPEGAGLAVNYATNDFMMEEHTGAQVPLMANEVGRGLVPGMVTQPEIYGLMFEHLGLGTEK
ncbi:MAG: alkaline phosphatase [Myxococcota bacterium]|nr:alkaline phosphatase [Myxococcota bacterium]